MNSGTYNGLPDDVLAQIKGAVTLDEQIPDGEVRLTEPLSDGTTRQRTMGVQQFIEQQRREARKKTHRKIERQNRRRGR